MSTFNKGLGKVEVGLRWDPSPLGAPDHDLDLIAAAYTADAPYNEPDYVVHFDSRSPDGTITLNRDSRTGQGFGYDEVMTLEFDRIAERYTRVVVGAAIQQTEGHRVFGDIANTGVRIAEGYTELSTSDLTEVARCTAATVAEFTRDETGAWELHPSIRGFDAAPASFFAELDRLV